LEETAVGIRTLANVAMARALRVISVERGLDPAHFALLAFGGAGPMHACALAEELGIRRILIPAFAGVLSALGMALADLRRDYRRAVLQPLRQLEGEGGGSLLAQWAEPLIRQAKADLQEPELSLSLDLRYRGQSFELEIPAQLSDPVSRLEQRFHQAHRQRYGWQDPDQEVEVIQLRLRAVQALPRVPLQAPPPLPGDPLQGKREAWFGGRMRPVPVYNRRHMGVGFQLCGPAIVEMPEATVVIEAGWTGSIDAVGTLVLSCE
jgi:N-methylhydantoinase A